MELTEAKAFGSRETFADDKSIMMSAMTRIVGSLKGNLDQKLIRSSKREYGNLKQEFHDSLFDLFNSHKKGDLTIGELEKLWKSEIKAKWERAYQLGVGSVGNPFGAKNLWDEDKVWLKGAEREEYGYLSKFLDDIKNNALKMDAEKRLEMYVQTLDGIYHHGQVEGSPDYVSITWRLGDSEHCPDCIEFAAGSPYTKDTLPCVPRDGNSRCLSKCKCYLTYKYLDKPPAEAAMKILGPQPLKVPESFRLPTHDEYDHLSRISIEMDQVRGLIDMSSGAQRREYIAARRDLNKELHDYAQKRSIYYVPKSGYIQGEKPPTPKLPKVLAAEKPKPPKGYRYPTEIESEKITKLANEIQNLRALIAMTPAAERKAVIAKRYKVNQDMIDYMEKRKIYFPLGDILDLD